MNTLETINQDVLFSRRWAEARLLELQKREARTKNSLTALLSYKYYPEDPFSLVPRSPELVCSQVLFLQLFLPHPAVFHMPSLLSLLSLLLLF